MCECLGGTEDAPELLVSGHGADGCWFCGLDATIVLGMVRRGVPLLLAGEGISPSHEKT